MTQTAQLLAVHDAGIHTHCQHCQYWANPATVARHTSVTSQVQPGDEKRHGCSPSTGCPQWALLTRCFLHHGWNTLLHPLQVPDDVLRVLSRVVGSPSVWFTALLCCPALCWTVSPHSTRYLTPSHHTLLVCDIQTSHIPGDYLWEWLVCSPLVHLFFICLALLMLSQLAIEVDCMEFQKWHM